MKRRVDSIEEKMIVSGPSDGRRLLILSCDTGDGHNAAAHAVREAWNAEGGYSGMIDAMYFLGEEVQKSVRDAYFFLALKTPAMFGRLYRTGDLWSSGLSRYIRSPIYAFNVLLANRLASYLELRRFDAILCTHLFPMLGLTNLARRQALGIPRYAVFTDYVLYPFVTETDLDLYFTPHEKITALCVENGMNPEAFAASGIPTAEKFQTAPTRTDARRMLGFGEREKLYLVMGGGMGFGDPAELLREIFLRDAEAKIVCLVGKNKDLRERLARSFPDKAVELVPFTTEVPAYMRAADVLLSKPGGLSSTEAIVSNVPFVHTAPIPGLEKNNREFFCEYGLSLSGETPADCAEAAVRLVHDAALREAMLQQQRAFAKPLAARTIAQRILNDLQSDPYGLPR